MIANQQQQVIQIAGKNAGEQEDADDAGSDSNKPVYGAQAAKILGLQIQGI